MEIFFKSTKLKEICSSARILKKQYGDLAIKIQNRLDDISAAANVLDLVAGRPHPLRGNLTGKYAVKLNANMRLLFEPANEPIPLDKDGSVDWKRVTMVRIVSIEDYHE